MPFLGNAGQLTHIFVTTLGENNANGDKNVKIDGAVKASDFKVDASSLANISPTLQAVMNQDASSTVTMQLSNPTTSLIASGEVIANSFRGSGSGLTNIPSSSIIGGLSTNNITNNSINAIKLQNNSVTSDKIVDSAVSTSKIANGAVTGVKLSDASITTNKIVNSSVTSAKLANGSVTADKIAAGAVGTAFIGDKNVTTTKLADLAVTTIKLDNAAVTEAKIANAAVTEAKIANSSVTSAKIANSGVTTEKIADSGVTTAKIADSGVTTAKIADGAVTAAKIATGSITAAQIQDASISLDKLTSTEFSLAQIQDNEIAGAKLQRHTITGGSSSLSGNSRSEIGLLTIHNDNIRNGTIDQTKLNSSVTLSSITGRGATTSDAISITNATNSSSTSTGALTVNGGIGVGGKVYATSFHGDGSGLTGISSTLQAITTGTGSNTTSNKILITNTTDSGSTSTGALIVDGGVGVGGKVYATSFHGDGSALTGISSTLQAITSSVGGNSTSNKILITNTTDSSSTSTGALIVDGGVGVGGKVYATSFHGDGSALTGISSTLQAITTGAGSNTTSNKILITNTTDSSSTSTGALIVDGGVGVGGKVYATSFHGDGSALTGISSTLQAITSSVGGNSTSNKILITNNSATTGALSGAVQVTGGGMYVSGNVFTGENMTVTGNLTVNGTTTTVNSTSMTVDDTIIQLANGNDSGTKDVGLIFGKPNSNVAFFYDTSASKLQLGLTESHAGSDTITLSATQIPVNINGSVTVTNTTDATSGGAGSITTQGGIYAAKQIYAGNDITAFSDKRYKSNIERIENALDKVCRLGGYTFDYNGDRKTGVLAQEIKEVLPEAVYGSEDTTYSVAYGNLAGIIIEAIKELKNEIQELKNN